MDAALARGDDIGPAEPPPVLLAPPSAIVVAGSLTRAGTLLGYVWSGTTKSALVGQCSRYLSFESVVG